MFRIPALAAFFAVGLTTTALADSVPDSLNSRIQQAAESHCAPLLSAGHTSLVYKKWHAECISASSAKIMARVVAAQGTSTALLAK